MQFIEGHEYKEVTRLDLLINFDSIQEMPTNTAMDYIERIFETSEYFYSKNTIFKYHPSVINLEIENKDQYQTALKMGICKDVFNIYDTEELNKAQLILPRTILKLFNNSKYQVA